MINIIDENQLSLRIKQVADDIISFASSYELHKYSNKQKKQQSKSSSSPSQVADSLDFLWNQILNNKCKQIIQIPYFLHSLTLLTNYKQNIPINNEQDQQSKQIRNRSILCLNQIRQRGDEQNQSELINVGYGRALIIHISTAGGTEMQGYFEIQCGLNDIYYFLRDFHYGRNFYSSFPLLPILAKTCLEQIEEEGGNEEVETQINNTRYGYQNTKYEANRAKAEILNYYIDRSNTRPRWYQ